jgi:hypothetical protein
MSIFTRVFNRAGGYDDLAVRFPGGPEPQGARWDGQSVMFANTVAYKFCVTVVVADDGIWVQARPPAQGVQPAIFVPWAGVARVESVRLYWRAATRVHCGDPEAGVFTVWRHIWETADARRRATSSGQASSAGPGRGGPAPAGPAPS